VRVTDAAGTTRPGEVLCRVFDVQRCSIHDGPGIRTTVFFEGCALRCAWCQNPESFRRGVAAPITVRALMAEVLQDRDFYAVSGGGLTVSGGEPLLHIEPVRALLAEGRREGLHTCAQTSGAIPRAHLEAVLGLVDLFQFDLKHMDCARHEALTGAGNHRILENAAWLAATGAAVDFRMPVVPGVNDSEENLDATAAFLTRLGVSSVGLVPYHRLYLGKYAALGLHATLAGTEPPAAEHVARLTERLMVHGIEAHVDG
jgi:pyruvate formate lyase activating enzyme